MLIYLEHNAKDNDSGHDSGYKDGFFGLLRELKVEDLFHNRKDVLKGFKLYFPVFTGLRCWLAVKAGL